MGKHHAFIVIAFVVFVNKLEINVYNLAWMNSSTFIPLAPFENQENLNWNPTSNCITSGSLCYGIFINFISNSKRGNLQNLFQYMLAESNMNCINSSIRIIIFKNILPRCLKTAMCFRNRY